MYVIGIALAVYITGRRWAAAGGNRSLVYDIVLWAVPAGIVGARIYFDVTTPFDITPHAWWGPLAVWKGGLGVWGGIAAGTVVGVAGAPVRGERRPIHERGRPGIAGRASDRANRELLQPGVVRPAE
jgi:prolipoprotein diacylglyceryltransferase